MYTGATRERLEAPLAARAFGCDACRAAGRVSGGPERVFVARLRRRRRRLSPPNASADGCNAERSRGSVDAEAGVLRWVGHGVGQEG